MLYMMLVFGHLLATSMALGAIVATDLRMLSKLAHDKVRIPPPNEFVARLVTIALVLLWTTGAGMVWIGTRGNPDFLSPKLQGKLVLVLALTFNALVLHRITFPRLARGRSLGRWRFVDWLVIVLPVALSNCLWMFCAFLGIARPWNRSIDMLEVLQIAGILYAVALAGVTLVLAAAGQPRPKGKPGGFVDRLKRSLAAVGNLGQDGELMREEHRAHRIRPAAREGARLSEPPHVARDLHAANMPLRGAWSGSAPRRRA
jgi:hypothetical protein